MSLQERLVRIREGFQKTAPPDVVALMRRVTEDRCRAGAGVV